MLSIIAFPSWAACINPAGVEGEIIYNRKWTTLQFCDGSKWIGIGGRVAATDGDYSGVEVSDAGSVWTLKAQGDVGSLQFKDGSGFVSGNSKLKWNDTTNVMSIAGTIKDNSTIYNIARSICYSGIPAAYSSRSVIMVPFTNNSANLDTVCSSNINASWSSIGIAKGSFGNQDCLLGLDNQFFGGGYTSFVTKVFFNANKSLYPSCNSTNAVICCVVPA